MIRCHVGQLIVTVEEATVPDRAVHRSADTFKRSLYMIRAHVGHLKGTVTVTVPGRAVYRPPDTYKRSGAM
jgi:hypothetical protein